MAETYHIKIKKEYAAALIDDLIKINAVEDLAARESDLPQWQKDALDKEIIANADDPNYAIPWGSVKNRFKHS